MSPFEHLAALVDRYRAIMDGAPIDAPIDADAQREAREWLKSRCQGTDTGPINIHVASGDAGSSIAHGIGESVRKWFATRVSSSLPRPTPPRRQRARLAGKESAMNAKEIETINQWWINHGIPSIAELAPVRRPDQSEKNPPLKSVVRKRYPRERREPSSQYPSYS